MKPGDRVECIDSGGHVTLTVGTHYIVETTSKYSVRLEGIPFRYSKLRFKIVGEAMTESFNWQAFQEVISKSGNICSGARQDIANAIAAGKGEPTKPVPKAGQVWQFGEQLRLLACGVDGKEIVINPNSGSRSSARFGWQYNIDTYNYKYVAGSIEEYYASR